METRATRIGLTVWTGLVVLFLWIPLVLIGVYAFNASNIQSWPIPGWTTHWFSDAWHDPDVRSSLWLSVKVGLVATGFAHPEHANLLTIVRSVEDVFAALRDAPPTRVSADAKWWT